MFITALFIFYFSIRPFFSLFYFWESVWRMVLLLFG